MDLVGHAEVRQQPRRAHHVVHRQHRVVGRAPRSARATRAPRRRADPRDDHASLPQHAHVHPDEEGCCCRGRGGTRRHSRSCGVEVGRRRHCGGTAQDGHPYAVRGGLRCNRRCGLKTWEGSGTLPPLLTPGWTRLAFFVRDMYSVVCCGLCRYLYALRSSCVYSNSFAIASLEMFGTANKPLFTISLSVGTRFCVLCVVYVCGFKWPQPSSCPFVSLAFNVNVVEYKYKYHWQHCKVHHERPGGY